MGYLKGVFTMVANYEKYGWCEEFLSDVDNLKGKFFYLVEFLIMN